ncbi:hypothetical protein Taro_013269 [Colocasia esculenta]|uniref:Protein kinase domain-containing protein n=1 Tax=Colocasia esculenta TaxID=4460 RepID=A0A843UF41_COLES|nr:hypothetical protein [Colocasia esculenta]
MDTSRRTGPQLVLFSSASLLGAWAGVPKGARLGPADVWSAGVMLFLDLVEVERQLDLSSMAARLRGSLVLFVQVKESRRFLVPLLVRDRTVAESALRHQQNSRDR